MVTSNRFSASCFSLIASLFLFGSPATGRADFQATISSNGNTVSLAPAFGGLFFNGTVGNFQITVAMSMSNSPGSGSLASLSIDTVRIQNISSSTQTLTMAAAATGFSTGQIGAPLTLTSLLAGILSQGSGTSTLTMQSFVDPQNRGLGSFPFGSAFGTTLSTTLEGGLASQFFGLNTSAQTPFLFNGEPYSLASLLTITLAGGGSLNFVAGKTEVIVPEPATLVGCLSGIACIGAYRFRRRARRHSHGDLTLPA